MTVSATVRSLGLLGLFAASMAGAAAFAQDEGATVGAASAVRPKIGFNRWQEDWSVLADPSLRTEPLDDLKYIPLLPDDPRSYVSFGLDLRERFESNDAPFFGVGKNKGDSYLLQRLETHADIRPNADWQIFAQIEDDRAPGKAVITPVDEDRFDLEQAFVTYTNPFAGGLVKIRLGRQEMAFDLQRFVSVRDGPNVRQAFDAAWLDWERESWRLITFWSEPVQYRHKRAFDDFSNGDFQYGGFRVERKNVGPGELSAYYSRFKMDRAVFLDARGDETRDIFDVRYAGGLNGVDWDLEGMGQTGGIGDKSIRAWAIGSIAGYTFSNLGWSPRLGLQVDAASGDRHPHGGTLETFNPLFPNGYYFTLAGYTGYVNLIHVKPSITVRPASGLALLAGVGLQWRETTADAVYVQPNFPVAGTAGKDGHWTGAYGQIRADWAISPNFAAAVEAVHYEVANVIRRAGGHNSDYLGVELKFGW